MSEEIVLYTNPQSRGRIARWMLEEVGAPYRVEVLDYGTTMKAPAFLALNPMGKVPTIQHRGVVVSECAAICAYLADAFPDAGLAPALDDPTRGAYFRWMFFGAGPLEAAVTAKSLGLLAPEDRAGMAGYGTFDQTVDALETAMSTGHYILGDAFSAVDVYLGAQIAWGLQFKSLPERPSFTTYAQRIMARPAAVRAAALDDSLPLSEPAIHSRINLQTGNTAMTSRLILSSALLTLAVIISACASTDRAPGSNYDQELTQLTSDCAERGGILSPIGGATTGRPQTDYACRISGGATRIP